MYAKLLSTVHQAIETAARPRAEENRSDFYNMLFDPEHYKVVVEKRRQREQLKENLQIATTVVAVVGEVYHIVKRHQNKKK